MKEMVLHISMITKSENFWSNTKRLKICISHLFSQMPFEKLYEEILKSCEFPRTKQETSTFVVKVQQREGNLAPGSQESWRRCQLPL